jgi:hypothetical protein
MSSNKRHTQKRRRQLRAALKFGSAAKPTHHSKSGRTGTAHSRKMMGRRPKDKA